jgi:hypothetical protein
MFKSINALNKSVIWDTTSHYLNYPKKIKIEYRKNYIKYLHRYNVWIEKISRLNKFNINWWLSTLASRDERESNIYHYICVLITLEKIKKKKILKYIITDSKFLKIVIEKNFNNLFIIKLKKNFLFGTKVLIKNFLFFFFHYILIKIIFLKKKKKLYNSLIGLSVVKKKNYHFYGNFYKKKDKDILISPTFTNTSIRNFIYYIFSSLKKKNIIFKENYLRFYDLFKAFNYSLKVYYLKRNLFNFNKINFYLIFKEELKKNRYSRSVIQGYLNYFFFMRLKEKGFIFKKIINNFENQIVDKGWNYGVNKFYKNSLNIGIQSASFHPQFQNLYPTYAEYKFNVIPKYIYLTGKFFLKERRKFFKNIKFFLTKDYKFKNIRIIDNKNINILVLLSGFKSHDEELINIFKKEYNYFINKKIFVYFKFHPILNSEYIFKNINNFIFFKEIKGDGASIIQKSKIVVTSSFTAGLYEALIRNCYTFLYDMHPLDYKLYKKFNYIKNLFFIKNSYTLIKFINKFYNQDLFLSKKNKNYLLRLKKYFFNKLV